MPHIYTYRKKLRMDRDNRGRKLLPVRSGFENVKDMMQVFCQRCSCLLNTISGQPMQSCRNACHFSLKGLSTCHASGFNNHRLLFNTNETTETSVRMSD